MVCLTSEKYVKKQKIPPQAVSNNFFYLEFTPCKAEQQL